MMSKETHHPPRQVHDHHISTTTSNHQPPRLIPARDHRHSISYITSRTPHTHSHPITSIPTTRSSPHLTHNMTSSHHPHPEPKHLEHPKIPPRPAIPAHTSHLTPQFAPPRRPRPHPQSRMPQIGKRTQPSLHPFPSPMPNFPPELSHPSAYVRYRIDTSLHPDYAGIRDVELGMCQD